MDGIKELLSDPNKGVNKAQGVLAYLFRGSLLWLKIKNINWSMLCTEFFKRPWNADHQDLGNLNKALCNPSMPWGAFIKGIDLINPKEAYFEITLRWEDREPSIYKANLDASISDDGFDVEGYGDTDSNPLFAGRKNATGALARWLRYIIVNEGYTPEAWHAAIREYILNPFNGQVAAESEIPSVISKMQRALLDKKISWDTFRRGIDIMNPDTQEYRLILRTRLYNKEPLIIPAISQNPAKARPVK